MRLINSEELKHRVNNSKYYGTERQRDFCDMIAESETIDAVEVVRCKDCLMTKERDEYTNNVWCCRHREYMDEMYYCADGLRREESEVEE